MTLFVAAVLPSLAAPGAAADRGLAWRVMGSDGRGRAVCQDGDARCDRDGTADGACMFGVALCLDGAAAVRVRGAGAAALTQALAALAAPAICTAEVPVRVRAGRRAHASALARDPASGHRERRRLRLACLRPPRPRAARAVIVTTAFYTGLLPTVGVRLAQPPPRPTTPIHSDAVVGGAGERVSHLDRRPADNLPARDP